MRAHANQNAVLQRIYGGDCVAVIGESDAARPDYSPQGDRNCLYDPTCTVGMTRLAVHGGMDDRVDFLILG